MFHFETTTFEPNEMNNIRNHFFIDKFVLNVFNLKKNMTCFVVTSDINPLQLTSDAETLLSTIKWFYGDDLGTSPSFFRRLQPKF